MVRTDPRTGQNREFTEWQEINREASSPYTLRKATETREVLWELEGLCARKDLHELHAKMFKRLEVTPATGHRAPTVEEFLLAGQTLMTKLFEFVNYKRLSISAALAKVLSDPRVLA